MSSRSTTPFHAVLVAATLFAGQPGCRETDDGDGRGEPPEGVGDPCGFDVGECRDGLVCAISNACDVFEDWWIENHYCCFDAGDSLTLCLVEGILDGVIVGESSFGNEQNTVAEFNERYDAIDGFVLEPDLCSTFECDERHEFCCWPLGPDSARCVTNSYDLTTGAYRVHSTVDYDEPADVVNERRQERVCVEFNPDIC